MFIFSFCNSIYSKQTAGKSCRFTEGYEEGLVDLSLRFDEDAAEESDFVNKIFGNDSDFEK